MAFENIGENIGKKMGPFPVWVWGVLIGGSFVIWYWVTQRSDGADVTTTEGTGTVPTPSGDFGTVPVLPDTGGQTQDEHTNQEWLIQAVEAASAFGVSYVAAQAALMKFLYGAKLTTQEQSIVDKAIARVGSPPEGVSGIPDIPPVVDSPEAKPVDWTTKTTISTSSKTRFGSTQVITIRVDWVAPKGHTTKPRGTVSTSIDGGMDRDLTLVNGIALRSAVIGKNVDAFKDKVYILRARYNPSNGAKAKASSANPVTVRIS